MVTTAVAMAMEDTGEATMADTVDTTARGLLMLSLRLRLTPASCTEVSATDTAVSVLAMVDTAMPATLPPSLRILSVMAVTAMVATAVTSGKQ